MIFLLKICSIIDGKFNTIFVDTEKKSLNFKKNHLTNVERAVKENIKKSYLKFIKQMILLLMLQKIFRTSI